VSTVVMFTPTPTSEESHNAHVLKRENMSSNDKVYSKPERFHSGAVLEELERNWNGQL
jgi:hypothetical protein